MTDFIAPAECCWPFDTPQSATQLALAPFDSSLFDDAAFGRHGVSLPAALARAVAKRRAEYLAGRLCARAALAALDAAPGALESLPDRRVDWPPGYCGAITHSRSLAGALVAPGSEYCALGLDAEQWLGAERARYLAPSILHREELEALTGLSPDAFARAVTLVFSLKESLYKALYPLTGVRFYFHDARVIDLDPLALPGRCRLALCSALNADWPAGSEVAGDFCDARQQALTAVMVAATPAQK
ncbi:4'-phosphopantetheinyl transferase family protein [Kushneria aurantia]|uniref:Enterobactin synthase component D n=1 Tax=Kushneria aurantia TaxID=504092 RepID=A0ABV6G584_9GAMM|nr:4'-phosphopantetheinyl transferase superfamily protein [Kushneria aurantia]